MNPDFERQIFSNFLSILRCAEVKAEVETLNTLELERLRETHPAEAWKRLLNHLQRTVAGL